MSGFQTVFILVKFNNHYNFQKRIEDFNIFNSQNCIKNVNIFSSQRRIGDFWLQSPTFHSLSEADEPRIPNDLQLNKIDWMNCIKLKLKWQNWLIMINVVLLMLSLKKNNQKLLLFTIINIKILKLNQNFECI